MAEPKKGFADEADTINLVVPMSYERPDQSYLNFFGALCRPDAPLTRLQLRSKVGLLRVGLSTFALGVVAGLHLFLLFYSLAVGRVLLASALRARTCGACVCVWRVCERLGTAWV